MLANAYSTDVVMLGGIQTHTFPLVSERSLHWTTSKWLGAPVSSFTYCSLLVTLSHRVSRICALTIPVLSPAPEHGFEPQLTESESVVLPLDDSGIRCYKSPIPVTLRCLLVGNEMFCYWTNRAVVPVAYSSNSNPERIPTALAGNKRERMRRIELPQSAWKAEALPLCNIRIGTFYVASQDVSYVVAQGGVEPTLLSRL